MRVVYGPIRTLGLGKVIAVDPISRHPKICNFNCVYCSLGHGGMLLLDRTDFIDVPNLMQQVGECMHHDECDTVIFKGTGEPLLAKNIFQLARQLHEVSNKKVALLTNCSMLGDQCILDGLDAFDIVVAKLDAASEKTFNKVNRPHPSIRFHDLLEGIKEARRRFNGSFRVQITLVKENLSEMEGIACICREICPDYVYLHYPEHCDPFHQIGRREYQAAMEHFFGIKCVSSQEKK